MADQKTKAAEAKSADAKTSAPAQPAVPPQPAAPAQPAPTANGNDAKRTYESAQLTGISADVPMPANMGKSNRGGRSLYPFDDLEVGQSFGVRNKTQKQLASTVSGATKRHRVEVKDANGNTVFKTTDVKQADGSVVKQPTLDPQTQPGRIFVSADVDPKTDPDGASVRVWRTA